MLTITGTLLLSLASILVRHYPNNVPRHPKCPLTTIPDRRFLTAKTKIDDVLLQPLGPPQRVQPVPVALLTPCSNYIPTLGRLVSKCASFKKVPLGSSVSVANSILISDPFVVIVLSISFIASIFFLHITAKIIRAFTN